MIRLSRRRQALVWGWAGLALVAIYVRGRQVELDQHVTNRLRFHAIPVAMSVLYHGRQHDYTAFQSLAFGFQGPGSVDATIAWARDYMPAPDDSTYFWAADDRGMADYVIGAFALFGPHSQSLYSFYFVVLGISVVLFLLDLGWNPVAGAVMFFALAAFYIGLSVIPLGNLSVNVFEPGSLYEPRITELLAYVATLHLGLAAVLDARWPWRRIAIAAAQALVLALCYHARSSVGWEVAFVMIASVGSWLWRRRLDRLGAPWAAISLATVLMLVIGYERAAYNPRYFQDVGARTVWHNALMGVSANPNLLAKYKLSISDAAAVNAVIAYLQGSNDPRLTSEWTETHILATMGGHGSFDWSVYEQAARALYWHIWRVDTSDMLRCYFWNKPGEMFAIVGRAIKGEPSPSAGGRLLSFNPLAVGALAIILPGLFLTVTNAPTLRPVIVLTVLLLGLSAVPGLLFYPVVHTMMAGFVTIALLLYLTAAELLTAAARTR